MTHKYSGISTFISQSKDSCSRLVRSKFARDAALLMILNLASRIIGFFGSTYAARCLGPINLGTSALIQTTAQQVSLAYEGGFGVVGVRKVAADKNNSQAVIEAISTFQLLMALILSTLWLILVHYLVPEYQRFAWMLGVSGLIIVATNITYAFQGLERLPTQTAIATICSILSAASYLIFFTPGMFLGADLIVITIVGLIGTVLAWAAYYKIFRRLPISRLRWRLVITLLRESWRYWISSILISSFDLIQIPIIIYFLGAHQAGVYRAALMLVLVPELLFGSINALLLAKLVAWREQGLAYMWQRQSQLVRLYSIGGGILVGILILAMPFVSRHLLGSEYQNAVRLFNILAVFKLGVFIGQVYVFGIIAVGLDKLFQKIVIIGIVIALPFMIFLTPAIGIMAVPIAMIICMIFSNLLCYVKLRHHVITNFKC